MQQHAAADERADQDRREDQDGEGEQAAPDRGRAAGVGGKVGGHGGNPDVRVGSVVVP